MDGKAAPRGSGADIAALRDIVSAQAQRYLRAESPSPVSVQRNAVLRACLEKARTATGALHPHRTHRRRQDLRLPRLCAGARRRPEDEAGHLCHPLYVHHRPDRRRLLEACWAQKMFWPTSPTPSTRLTSAPLPQEEFAARLANPPAAEEGEPCRVVSTSDRGGRGRGFCRLPRAVRQSLYNSGMLELSNRMVLPY